MTPSVKPPTRVHLLRRSQLAVQSLCNFLAPLAFGLVISDVHGWLRVFLISVAALSIINNALTQWLIGSPHRVGIDAPVWGAMTVMLEKQGSHAPPEAAAKQGTETLQ